MNRRVLLWAVLVLAFSAVSMAANAPSVTIRWDTIGIAREGSQAVPQVYTLGTPLSFPMEIGVDESGRLYIYDELRQCISRFAPTGELDKSWLEDTGPGRLDGFHELSILSDERVLMCSGFWPGYMLKFGPDPEKVDRLPGVQTARGFAAWDDGSYLICESIQDGKSYRAHVYSATGELQTSWDTPKPESVAIGPDNLIYVVTSIQSEIRVCDRKGKHTKTIDVKPAFTDLGAAYTTTASMAIDRNGDIYLSDRMYIVRLDRNGRPLARWQPASTSSRPVGATEVGRIAVRNGLVYALISRFSSDTEVQAYTADGQCIARYQPAKLPLDLPAKIEMGADGSYIVGQNSVVSDRRSLVFDSADKPIPDVDTDSFHGLAPCPTGGYYTHDYTGMLWVSADRKSSRVVFDFNKDAERMYQTCTDEATGRTWVLCFDLELICIDPDGQVANRVQLPKDMGIKAYGYMAVDPGGFLYICSTEDHQIRKFKLDGTYVGALGKMGAGIGELRRPRGIDVDSEGRLLVCDARNNRIQVFSREGEPLGVWGTYGRGDGELDRPNDLAIGPNKVLFIADTHNDRIVKVPLADFWKQLTKEIKAPPAYVAAEKVPMPIPGEVTVEGIVVAGTDDFTDCVYIQAADRSWGTRVTMPANVPANRGDRIKVTGTLELKEHSARYLQASKSEYVLSAQSMPGPLGMANLYVGDGYRMGDKRSDLSNLGLLVKSWGRVLMVDPLNKRFVISDGSRLGNAPGLEVYGGQLKSPLTQWPKFGRYVMVTGISAVRPAGNGTFQPAIRLRAQEDLQVLENG